MSEPPGIVTAVRKSLDQAVADEQTLGTVARTILDNADTMVVRTDRAGRILYVNPAFSAITGYSAAEAVGGTLRLLRSGAERRAAGGRTR